MTPKSLLRHKVAVSPLTSLSAGEFQLVIAEVENLEAKKTRRVVFCSGKVYYDLLDARQVHGIDDVAIVRIEQLYPFPIPEYAALLKQYNTLKTSSGVRKSRRIRAPGIRFGTGCKNRCIEEGVLPEVDDAFAAMFGVSEGGIDAFRRGSSPATWSANSRTRCVRVPRSA